MRIIDAIGLLFRRLVTIAILIGIVAGVCWFLFSSFIGKDSKIPNIEAAPWAIQTSTRIYYAQDYKVVDGVPVIIGFWTLDGENYNYHKGVKDFPAEVWGKVSVYPRLK